MENFGKMKGDYGGMGMLKSISLENYKCFDKLDNFEIAPLTVLCGVNSSGKSSILKSLLMLKQSFESNYDKNSLLFNGDYTINGAYNDVVFEHKTSRKIKITNQFVIENNRYIPAFEKAALNDLANTFRIDVNTIKQLTVSFTVELKNKTSSKYVHDNIIHLYRIDYDVVQSDINLFKNSITIISQNTGKYNIRLYSDLSKTEKTYESYSCFFQGLVLSKIVPGASVEQINDNMLSLIYSLSKIVSYQYKGIKYIAPVRKEPNRIYEIFQDENDVGLYGESTPQVLYSHKEDRSSCVNPPVNEILKTDRFKGRLIDCLNLWCNYLGIEQINFPDKKDYTDAINLKIGSSNYADVGFGVSQILPVITMNLLMKWHETLILQQPEIHLHPKMQMDFSDFLLVSAYTGKNIIIETHSDHIINRITRRVMEDPAGRFKKLVKIYYVEKTGTGSNIYRDIDIDPVDGIVNAPDGFFTQFGTELMHITQRGMRNYKEGVSWRK